MSDSFIQDTKAMTDKLIVDSKDQLKKLQKVKAMTKLAHDLGEDTGAADQLINAAEGVLKDMVSKFAIKK